MPFRSLRDFMELLEARGNLCRVSCPVSTELEMTEIQTRLLAEQGPAVLLKNRDEKRENRQIFPFW